jgi:bifunctional non-homologous end joining protein LigD
LKTKAGSLEQMLCLATDSLPEGDDWAYELKLDGYPSLALKADRQVFLLSRRNNDLSQQFPKILAALRGLPDETVIDGEIVAVDEQGRPSFNLLQNHLTAETQAFYYLFDVLSWAATICVSNPGRPDASC